MIRKGIEYSDIEKAIEILNEKKEKISIKSVRDTIGGGSPNTVGRLLKEWREKSKSETTDSLNNKISVITSEIPLIIPKNTVVNKPENKIKDDLIVETGIHQKKINPLAKDEFNKSINITVDLSKNGKEIDDLVKSAKDLSKEMLNFMDNEWDIILKEENQDVKIKKLHSALVKEQYRREIAEKTAMDARIYADSIKSQVSNRLNDLKENLESEIAFLNGQIRALKKTAKDDVDYYRKYLSTAVEMLNKFREE